MKKTLKMSFSVMKYCVNVYTLTHTANTHAWHMANCYIFLAISLMYMNKVNFKNSLTPCCHSMLLFHATLIKPNANLETYAV